MKDKELEVIDGFIKNFDHLVNDLENFSQFLQLGGETDKLRKDAMKILKKKSKQMMEAETKKELKEVLKVNKLLEKKGLL